MSGRSRAFAAAAALSALVACGIDLVGSATAPPMPDAEAGTPPPLPPPAPPTNDGASDADADDLDAADAGSDAPRCDSGTIVDPLVTFDGGTWIIVHDGSNGDHPKIETNTEDAASASLLTPGATYSIGGIWLSQPRRLRALDLSFHYVIGCPDGGACQDGLAVVWLAATDAGAGSDLAYYVSSPSFGIPADAHGGGVAFDLFADPGPQDTPAPNVSLLTFDGGLPASYDWTTQSTAPRKLDGAHDVLVKVRSGVVTVTVDGVATLGGTTPTDFDAWLGFTASTGAAAATFYVSKVNARFYACDDP